jgi:hypothetical protein
VSRQPRPSCFAHKRGLEGDDAAARASLAVIEEARERQGAGQSRISAIVLVSMAPGSVTSPLIANNKHSTLNIKTLEG